MSFDHVGCHGFICYRGSDKSIADTCGVSKWPSESYILIDFSYWLIALIKNKSKIFVF